MACDIPSLVYSFSFAQNPDWTSMFPSGPEFVKYLHKVAARFGITDKIQLNTSIDYCKWLEDEEIWELELRHMAPGTGDLSVQDRHKLSEREGEKAVFVGREKIRAKVVVSAVGGLVEPNAVPKGVKGWENFEGEIFHSARWRYDIDLKDKNVVVLGTGCSAAQFVPHITKTYGAKSCTQLMRSPPWVVPRAVPPGGQEQFKKWAPWLNRNIPGLQQFTRMFIFTVLESHFALFGNKESNTRYRARYEEKLLQHMRKTVPEKYHEMLTPDYGVGCKRRIFDATWFPALNDPKLELSTKPLTQVNARSVIIGPGQSYPVKDAAAADDTIEIPADVIILGNGFQTQKFLHPLKVIGKGGADLVETMDSRGGPQMYMGTAMDGFPNLWTIFGPNVGTGHHSVILASENQTGYSLQFIKKILDGDASTVEVKREAEEKYTSDIQSALKKMVWGSGGCSSWYVHDGWNSHMSPYSQFWYMYAFKFPVWSDWNINLTRKGLYKKRLSQLVKMAGLVALLLGTYKMQQSGEGLDYFRNLALPYVLRGAVELRKRAGF